MTTQIRQMSPEEMDQMLEEHYRLNPVRGVSKTVIQSLNMWVMNKILPGGFLTAVLENNLKEACARADSYNRATLFEIVEYCYMNIPAPCWGSPEKVRAWLNEKTDVN